MINLLNLKLVTQDIVIAEDDPYFFIQMGKFVPKSQRKAAEDEAPAGEEVSRFIDSLVPSFLRIDTQGRVIRMDTFSKVRPSSVLHVSPIATHYFSSYRQSRQGCGSGGLRAVRCSQSD